MTMVDYRKMYDDKEYFYAFDLDGRERTLEIERVVAGELTGEQNRKSKKPMVSFAGEKKKLALNKTNGKTIAALYGTDADRWAGESITLYPTTTTFGGQTVECIRVRPQRPDRTTAPTRPDLKQSSRSSKAAQSAADQSAIAVRYLVGEYAKCDSEEKLAELRAQRGKAWAQLSEADRETVSEAAHAAKARIDASSSNVSEDEAAEIARIEAANGG